MYWHCENGIKASTLTSISVTLTETYTSVCSKEDKDRLLRAKWYTNSRRKSDLCGCQYFGDILPKNILNYKQERFLKMNFNLF